MDAKRSMVSSILRLFAAQPARDDRGWRRSDNDQSLRSDREAAERKPADAIDSFVWSWQFPGQW